MCLVCIWALSKASCATGLRELPHLHYEAWRLSPHFLPGSVSSREGFILLYSRG